MNKETNKSKITPETVRSKTISGDRKIKGQKIGIFDYFRVQFQNPGIGFLSTVFFAVLVLLAIPIYPKVASAVELNEQKKVKFEEKLMPRSLAIPVNMLPYLRFQHLALKNGKYASWHEPVFRSGSCDQKNLATMPEGIYKRAIITGCFQFHEIQNQHSDLCKVDNCELDPILITRIDYIMSQIEEPYWGKGFVDDVNPCSGSLQRQSDEPCGYNYDSAKKEASFVIALDENYRSASL